MSEAVDVVSFYKCVGVYITSKRIWSKTKDSPSLQASKAVFIMFQYSVNLNNFVQNILTNYLTL